MKKQSLEIVEEEKDIKGRSKEEENKRKWRWQIFIFIFTYISYSMLHFIREGWSIHKYNFIEVSVLKPSVENEDSPGLNWMGSNNLGMVDFSFLICYSAGLFISGQLSDNFPIRIVLPTGFLLVCFATTMIWIGGYLEITNVAYYMFFFFAMSGFCQSIGWPSYIAVIGNWFPRYQRGLAFGIWWSWENIGNIGGNVLANFLVDVFEMDWMSAFLTVGVIVGIFGIINFVLLIEHPSRIGIVVETEEEIQEERIEKIFDKSIKPGYLRGKSIWSNDKELNENLNFSEVSKYISLIYIFYIIKFC